jgi:hypothetical protein
MALCLAGWSRLPYIATPSTLLMSRWPLHTKRLAIADVADKFGVKRGTLTLRNRLRRPQHFQLDITLSICNYI